MFKPKTLALTPEICIEFAQLINPDDDDDTIKDKELIAAAQIKRPSGIHMPYIIFFGRFVSILRLVE